jgi:hypothetical protein
VTVTGRAACRRRRRAEFLRRCGRGPPGSAAGPGLFKARPGSLRPGLRCQGPPPFHWQVLEARPARPAAAATDSDRDSDPACRHCSAAGHVPVPLGLGLGPWLRASGWRQSRPGCQCQQRCPGPGQWAAQSRVTANL